MKTIIFIILSFLISASIFAQSPLLTLFDESVVDNSFPYTANLYLAYDERDIDVGDWLDQSGNGLTLHQGTVDNQPTVGGGLNGYTTLLFDGANDWMSTANLATESKPFTIYLVMKPISWESTDAVFTLQQSGQALVFQEVGGAQSYYPNNGADFPYYATLTNGSFYIIAITFNDASSTLQVNNGVASTGSITTVATLLAYPFKFGGQDGYYCANMDVACFYLFTGIAHDLTTRTEIINWLNAKYGIF